MDLIGFRMLKTDKIWQNPLSLMEYGQILIGYEGNLNSKQRSNFTFPEAGGRAGPLGNRDGTGSKMF